MDYTAWREGIEAGKEADEFFDDVQVQRGQVGAIGCDGCLRELEVGFLFPHVVSYDLHIQLTLSSYPV